MKYCHQWIKLFQDRSNSNIFCASGKIVNDPDMVYMQETIYQGCVMKKPKKKKKRQTVKASTYLIVILIAILVILTIISIAMDSGDKYSGVASGKVTEIFYTMPTKSGSWTRMSEVSYYVDGKTYKISVKCFGSTKLGDNCEVRYRNEKPSDAYVEW